MHDVIDLSWWQPAGRTGVRLSYDRSTSVLFLFHAANGRTEVLGACDETFARAVADLWDVLGGPDYVRRVLR